MKTTNENGFNQSMNIVSVFLRFMRFVAVTLVTITLLCVCLYCVSDRKDLILI